MKTIRDTVARKGAWLTTMALVAAMYLGDAAFAQATPKPPERMTYQGFLTGADGTALGNSAPKAYDVLFRIYDAEQGGNLLWGEQQTVTVDKGYFSVLLGEGAAVTGVPNAGIVFSSLFTGATASDRFVGVTVKGIGSGGTDVDILPRVRFLSSPYAYLAASAVKLVQTTGADLLTSSGNTVTVSGSLVANGLTAGTITATNSVTAGILNGTTNITTPVLRAGAVTVTNGLTAGTLTVTNDLTAGSITAGSISAANGLDVPDIMASGAITASSLRITDNALVMGRGLATSGHASQVLRVVAGRYYWDTGTQNLEEQVDQPEHSVTRISKGRYRVTLTTPFSGRPYPVCAVSVMGAGAYVATVSDPFYSDAVAFHGYGVNYDRFEVHIRSVDSNGGWVFLDAGFNFILVGAN